MSAVPSCNTLETAASKPCTQAHEITLIDQILEGWGKWAQRGDVHLGSIATGFLLRIPSLLRMGHELVLSDDKFQIVDRSVAVLPGKLRQIVFIEYYRSDEESTSEAKARRAGLKRTGYRQQLYAAQWALYASLGREMDAWMA